MMLNQWLRIDLNQRRKEYIRPSTCITALGWKRCFRHPIIWDLSIKNPVVQHCSISHSSIHSFIHSFSTYLWITYCMPSSLGGFQKLWAQRSVQQSHSLHLAMLYTPLHALSVVSPTSTDLSFSLYKVQKCIQLHFFFFFFASYNKPLRKQSLLIPLYKRERVQVFLFQSKFSNKVSFRILTLFPDPTQGGGLAMGLRYTGLWPSTLGVS